MSLCDAFYIFDDIDFGFAIFVDTVPWLNHIAQRIITDWETKGVMIGMDEIETKQDSDQEQCKVDERRIDCIYQLTIYGQRGI